MVPHPSHNFFPSSTEQRGVAGPLLVLVFLLPILTRLLYMIFNPPPPHNPFLLGLTTRSWSPPTIITARHDSTRSSFSMGSHPCISLINMTCVCMNCYYFIIVVFQIYVGLLHPMETTACSRENKSFAPRSSSSVIFHAYHYELYWFFPDSKRQIPT